MALPARVLSVPTYRDLENERRDLDSKISALYLYSLSDNFNKQTKQEQYLVIQQQKIMQSYSDLLGDRMAYLQK